MPFRRRKLGRGSAAAETEQGQANHHQHRQPKMPAALVVAPACHVAGKRSVTQANPVGGHFGHGGNVVGNKPERTAR